MDNLETMSLEDLVDLQRQLEMEVSQLNSQQMAAKIQINAVYGAFAAAAFRYFDPRIAEAITQTGQLIVRLSELAVNEYLNAILKTNGKDYVIAVDTDSVVGDTLIWTNGKQVRIDELYDTVVEGGGAFIKRDDFNQDYVVRPNHQILTKSVTPKITTSERPITYVMKHRVKKRMFRIRVGGDVVTVTEDHSLCVVRDGQLISCKPQEIQPTDFFVRSEETTS